MRHLYHPLELRGKGRRAWSLRLDAVTSTMQYAATQAETASEAYWTRLPI